jgi:hypothetical protein
MNIIHWIRIQPFLVNSYPWYPDPSFIVRNYVGQVIDNLDPTFFVKPYPGTPIESFLVKTDLAQFIDKIGIPWFLVFPLFLWVLFARPGSGCITNPADPDPKQR